MTRVRTARNACGRKNVNGARARKSWRLTRVAYVVKSDTACMPPACRPFVMLDLDRQP